MSNAVSEVNQEPFQRTEEQHFRWMTAGTREFSTNAQGSEALITTNLDIRKKVLFLGGVVLLLAHSKCLQKPTGTLEIELWDGKLGSICQ